MSTERSAVSLYIFVLVLNLVFPVMSYTFTAWGSQSENYELTLDPDDLMTIGLNLIDGESHNHTFGSGEWKYYSLMNVSTRARWDTFRVVGAVYYDGIRFQKQSPISLAFNSWLSTYTVEIKSLLSNEWFVVLRNETIVRDFDTEFNWSRFVLKDGHHIFITPFANDGNITKAVYDDAHLNITLAKSFDESEERFNFWNFITWYGSIVIGSRSWGLPSIFSWVIRILAGISMLTVILLVKELTRV
jgi:hypothetical protein